MVNRILSYFGSEPIRWYAEPKYWKGILVAANIFRWSGYNKVIYLAELNGIDESYNEAATIGRRKGMRNRTSAIKNTMGRRYGLYRRDLNKLSKKSVELQVYYKGKPKEKAETERKTWKQRIIESFGKSPIKCPKCGKEMELWEIWSEKFGIIYHIFDELKTLKEVLIEEA